MLASVAFAQQWELNHLVTFDGVARRIIVAGGVTEIDIKADIYSSWKEWVQLYDNAKFLPALRTIGGDPLGSGVFAGDLYFLQNDWRVQVSELVNVTGSLFSDNGGSPYIIGAGGGVISTVSNLTQTVTTTQNVVTGDIGAVPTADSIAAAVWNQPTASNQAAGTTGEQLANATGLQTNQATMLLEMYELLGLSPFKPLVVTETSRSVVGTNISQTISSNIAATTVTRDVA